jgi:hypothetical protein
VAKEKDVLLIDLHALSRTLYQALGPDVGKAFQDGTHHNNFGSYELAKCVVQAVQNAQLPLAQNIARDFKEFDPSRPDPVDTFAIPFSPGAGGPRPLGD